MQITIDNLSYTYTDPSGQTVHALQSVSCSIDPGDFTGIIGRTGCGKTTLILLIAGLLTPTKGHIFLDGRDINDKSYDRNLLRQSIGVVFQYPEVQLFETTVEKDVAFGLTYSRLGSKEKEDRIEWALETMGFDFEKIRKQSPLALSGGEKRRVAIAGVLAVKPKILIFDEPIAGLDPYGRQNFMELVSRLNDDGTTIIMISHNMDALAEYTKRLIVLDEGKVIQSGKTRDIFLGWGRDTRGTEPQQIASLISKGKNTLLDDVVTYDDLIFALKKQLLGVEQHE